MTEDEQWEKEGAPLFAQAKELGAEPVPKAALARTRAKLRERLEAPPRVMPRLALATAVLATVAFAVWKSVEPDGPRDVVAAAAPVTFSVADNAQIELAPESRATVVSARELVLTRGRAKLRVTGGLTVRAAGVTLEAAATVFEVAFDADQVRFFVSEGVVRATRGADHWDVKAGEQWPAPAALAPPPPPMPEPPAEEQVRDPQALSQLEQAAVLTRQGRLDAARGIYTRLAKQEASIAEVALYHLARLEAQRAHRPKVALEALDELLARFPHGALAREAKLSRIEALRALGRTADAEAAAQELPDAGR